MIRSKGNIISLSLKNIESPGKYTKIEKFLLKETHDKKRIQLIY